MKQEKNKKKGIIIAGISAIVLIAVLGVSFAVWNYSRTTDNQILVAGDVYMKFKEKPALTIENAIPSEGPGVNDYFEFTIEGKNTYSKPIWYEIDLQYGEDHTTRKTRIKDSLLKFRLVEIKDGTEETVIDNASYSNLTNKKIWINTIAANTRSKVEITYRLYMWISSSTIIGNTSDAVYDMDTWNNDIYASIKVNVSGDFNEKELPEEKCVGNAVDCLKKVAGKESSGLYNLDPVNGNICDGNECKEYRYTGIKVKNYVKLNNISPSTSSNQDELWRIIGVFYDDEVGEEYIRIVKNELLSEEYLPDRFTIKFPEKFTKYFIKEEENNVNWNDAYDVGNDWTTAGLQYYLNREEDDSKENGDDSNVKGYMSYLSTDTKSLLQSRIHYLGVYKYDEDTAVSGYNNERKENPEGASTWNGKVSLMYPSDYGYSADKNYWKNTALYIYDDGANETSWMYKTFPDGNDNFWLISPSDSGLYQKTFYVRTGMIEGYVAPQVVEFAYFPVRPVLNLSSKVEIVSGDGSLEDPYELSIE